ncbi:ribonuclease R [Spirochaeta lutea]|uniref:ribonuclease R n=1 Tax=Spirochaeta lutea TaxID=1480694 RepID=UPI00068B2D18|nr:ribonuclease R [Spirochaeta lutea]
MSENKQSHQSGAKTRIRGVLSLHNRGFGFLLVPGGQDVFIPLDNIGGALDGDTVEAEVTARPKSKNPIGRIISVVSQGRNEFVGIYKNAGGRQEVLPEEDSLTRPIRVTKPGRAKNGQVVVVSRSGEITDVIGYPDETGVDLQMVARSKGLPKEFPPEVLAYTRGISEPNFRKLKKHRLDLRKELCFTIDPVSAKDFDDAISLRQLPSGMFELGVHIADVSYYVGEGSPLDAEARRRATSVYFVDHVIPMLPERLANELCSLRPDEDKPAYSVLMTINSRGDVVDYSIRETIIRSKRRFTYQEVEDILDGAHNPLGKTIHLLQMISLLLRRRREEDGSIDFDATVPVITLDANGIPSEVRPSQRLDAHRLVEECMLVANRTVARHVQALGNPPFVYRVHQRPTPEDAKAFLDLLKAQGIAYRTPGGELESEDYRKLLGIIENLDFKDLIEKVALRSMTKAVYSTENTGHFGLAFDAYTHFTSPIRRYPDLVIHRLLKKYALVEKPRADKKAEAELQQICENSTAMEIRATEAEREYTRIKSMQFLSSRVGESYEGIISGVTSFGIFVQLKDFLIDGLVHVSEMKDDRYELDKEQYQLTGQSTGKVLRLGDPVQVTIAQVSVEDQKADFRLVDPAQTPSKVSAVPRREGRKSSRAPGRTPATPQRSSGKGGTGKKNQATPAGTPESPKKRPRRRRKTGG